MRERATKAVDPRTPRPGGKKRRREGGRPGPGERGEEGHRNRPGRQPGAGKGERPPSAAVTRDLKNRRDKHGLPGVRAEPPCIGVTPAGWPG